MSGRRHGLNLSAGHGRRQRQWLDAKMTERRAGTSVKSASAGAAAVGAGAVGTLALGSFALGAIAVGAIAIGALAIGRLSVGKARFKRIEIDELTVRKLRVETFEQRAGKAGVAALESPDESILPKQSLQSVERI